MDYLDTKRTEAIELIKQWPQVQYSLKQQLALAYALCNRFGLYDAADMIDNWRRK